MLYGALELINFENVKTFDFDTEKNYIFEPKFMFNRRKGQQCDFG